MAEPGCHSHTDDPQGGTPRDRAKALILKTLGAKRVAGWVGVTEDAIYQGLSRATDAKPVPASWVPAIVAGAKAEGLEAPVDVLWPAMAGAAQ